MKYHIFRLFLPTSLYISCCSHYLIQRLARKRNKKEDYLEIRNSSFCENDQQKLSKNGHKYLHFLEKPNEFAMPIKRYSNYKKIPLLILFNELNIFIEAV
jgi:hypothetical protein